MVYRERESRARERERERSAKIKIIRRVKLRVESPDRGFDED